MDFKTSNKITPNFNMSSMTDVVFLLLIFFMIASTLAKNLNTIDVKLPQAKGKSENRDNVSVSIDSKNRFYINGEIVSKNNIKDKLITKLSNSNKRVARNVAVNMTLSDLLYLKVFLIFLKSTKL